MDYLDCQSARDELRMQKTKLEELRDNLIAEDGHNAFVLTQNAIAAVENVIYDLDDADIAIDKLANE